MNDTVSLLHFYLLRPLLSLFYRFFIYSDPFYRSFIAMPDAGLFSPQLALGGSDVAAASSGANSASTSAANREVSALNANQAGTSSGGAGTGYLTDTSNGNVLDSGAGVQVTAHRPGFISSLIGDIGDGDYAAAAHLISKQVDAAASWVGSELEHVAHGAVSAAVNLVTQPLAQLHDLGAILYGVGYNATHADTYQPNWWSSIGQQEMAGNVSTGQRLETLAASIPIVKKGSE